MTKLKQLAKEAAGCTRCDLYQRATETVFGAGRPRAPLMLVGEQPGDQEDKQGQPFVGPAGRLLDRALEDSGIKRGDAYVTNAVKHFKWVARGKRRIHQRPSGTEIMACQALAGSRAGGGPATGRGGAGRGGRRSAVRPGLPRA